MVKVLQVFQDDHVHLRNIIGHNVEKSRFFVEGGGEVGYDGAVYVEDNGLLDALYQAERCFMDTIKTATEQRNKRIAKLLKNAVRVSEEEIVKRLLQ